MNQRETDNKKDKPAAARKKVLALNLFMKLYKLFKYSRNVNILYMNQFNNLQFNL